MCAARAHSCACVCDVFAIYMYDNNILPRLILIIIILYFIQIRHTDDFPSTGSDANRCPASELLCMI